MQIAIALCMFLSWIQTPSYNYSIGYIYIFEVVNVVMFLWTQIKLDLTSARKIKSKTEMW